MLKLSILVDNYQEIGYLGNNSLTREYDTIGTGNSLDHENPHCPIYLLVGTQFSVYSKIQ
jgi:hypothetical protein